MKTLNDYWQSPETNEDDKIARKEEALELDAKRVVMQAKHDHYKALNDRDDYITGCAECNQTDFNKILDHVHNVKNRAAAYKIALAAYNELFPE